jgi:hypothetical protein
MLGKDNDAAVKCLLNQHQTERIDMISRAISICDDVFLLDKLKKVIAQSFGRLDWRLADPRDTDELVRKAALVTGLLQSIAMKKNSLAKNRGILLDDKPNPPRRGIMYKTARFANLR